MLTQLHNNYELKKRTLTEMYILNIITYDMYTVQKMELENAYVTTLTNLYKFNLIDFNEYSRYMQIEGYHINRTE